MSLTGVTRALSLIACLTLGIGVRAADAAEAGSSTNLPDIGGDWRISSSVGATGPKITVHCTLVQTGQVLTGSCTPEMENAEASSLTGSIDSDGARWGYDVVFNGNPGRVDFTATSVASEALSGMLSLSGTQAPFTAEKE